MLGPYTVGKKAAKHGYKRFGLPGAIAAGSAAAVGYVALRRALKRAMSGEDVKSAVDVTALKSAVEERGIGALGDKETVESAVDTEELESAVDIDEVATTAESEASDLQDEPVDLTDEMPEKPGDDVTDETPS